MDKEQALEWLRATVSDMFLDFMYYDRKEDEDMRPEQFKQLMADDLISKKDMLKAFSDQIEASYPFED